MYSTFLLDKHGNFGQKKSSQGILVLLHCSSFLEIAEILFVIQQTCMVIMM